MLLLETYPRTKRANSSTIGLSFANSRFLSFAVRCMRFRSSSSSKCINKRTCSTSTHTQTKILLRPTLTLLRLCRYVCACAVWGTSPNSVLILSETHQVFLTSLLPSPPPFFCISLSHKHTHTRCVHLAPFLSRTHIYTRTRSLCLSMFHNVTNKQIITTMPTPQETHSKRYKSGNVVAADVLHLRLVVYGTWHISMKIHVFIHICMYMYIHIYG